MTLNGRTPLYCTSGASLKAYHGNLKEDRPIPSAAKMYSRDSAFRWYKVHAGIGGGSVARGAQATVEWSEPATFSDFGRHMIMSSQPS